MDRYSEPFMMTGPHGINHVKDWANYISVTRNPIPRNAALTLMAAHNRHLLASNIQQALRDAETNYMRRR